MISKRIAMYISGLLGLVLWMPQSQAQPRLQFGPSLRKLKHDCNTAGRSASCAKAGVQLEQQGKNQEAVIFYQKACEAKIKPRGSACYLWGLLHTDKSQHLSIYTKGCALKDADSCTAAGEVSVKAKNIPAALGFYRQGCDGKDGRGCHRAARHLVRGKKLAEAQQYLRRSCAYGYSPGCGYLGWIYENMRKQLDKAERAYTAGCKLKGATECARLGLLLFRLQKAPKALRYLRRACKLGYRRSCKLARKLNMQINGPPKRR